MGDAEPVFLREAARESLVPSIRDTTGSKNLLKTFVDHAPVTGTKNLQ